MSKRKARGPQVHPRATQRDPRASKREAEARETTQSRSHGGSPDAHATIVEVGAPDMQAAYARHVRGSEMSLQRPRPSLDSAGVGAVSRSRTRVMNSKCRDLTAQPPTV